MEAEEVSIVFEKFVPIGIVFICQHCKAICEMEVGPGTLDLLWKDGCPWVSEP